MRKKFFLIFCRTTYFLLKLPDKGDLGVDFIGNSHLTIRTNYL